jgi:BMFP domain-containing protein YqiC
VSEYIWETFDSLFKTVHRHGRRVEELEARIAALEERLKERSDAGETRMPLNGVPADRAA